MTYIDSFLSLTNLKKMHTDIACLNTIYIDYYVSLAYLNNIGAV